MALNRSASLPRGLDRLICFGPGRGHALRALRRLDRSSQQRCGVLRRVPELHLDREMLADPGQGRA